MYTRGILLWTFRDTVRLAFFHILYYQLQFKSKSIRQMEFYASLKTDSDLL